MTNRELLSPEQQRVLEPSLRVVEAGPGSGKTRALVARFLDSAESCRYGVALLSFTNAAVEEARRRARESPNLLRSPHFVGTIDSFLHRFIVTPAEVPGLGKLPSYWDSWDDLSHQSVVHLKNVAGAGIPLKRFRVTESGSVELDDDLSGLEASYLSKIVAEHRSQQLLDVARQRINNLTANGIFDAATARARAFEIIDGAGGDAVMNRLSLRFEEVLVDEAQDCDGAELAIIRRLADRSRVVVVADPDQAVFEFRGSIPKLFLNYRDEQHQDHRAELSTNYRSSSSICRVLNSLRAAGVATIQPANEAACPSIFVLKGPVKSFHTKFTSILDEHGIETTNAMVLAHRRTVAFEAAGSTPTEGGSQMVGNVLAAACGVLKSSNSTPSDRWEAIRKLEKIVMSMIDWPISLRAVSLRNRLAAVDRSSEWLRMAACQLVNGLQDMADPAAFGVRSRELLKEILGPLPIDHVPLGNRVKRPEDDVWERCTSSDVAFDGLPCDTIHGAKGLEYEAVLVGLSRLHKVEGRDVLDHWAEGENTEARRVLYVGASRAQKVLAFGAGPNAGRLIAILESAGIPIESR